MLDLISMRMLPQKTMQSVRQITRFSNSLSLWIRRTQLRQSNMLDSRTHSDTMDINLSACVRLDGMDK